VETGPGRNYSNRDNGGGRTTVWHVLLTVGHRGEDGVPHIRNVTVIHSVQRRVTEHGTVTFTHILNECPEERLHITG
jgi:hypothetical protein